MSEEPLTPDWPEEVAEQIRRLGPPLSVHSLGEEVYSRRLRLSWLAILTSLFGESLSIIAFLVWGWQPNVPTLTFSLTILIGAGWNVWAIRRNRGFRVLRFETGLLVWQAGKLIGLHWDDIRSLQVQSDGLTALEMRETANGSPYLAMEHRERSWVRRLLPLGRIAYSQIQLTRKDGVDVKLPSYLNDFSLLSESVQVAVFDTHWPEFLRGFEEEGIATFSLKRFDLKWNLAVETLLEKIHVGREGFSYPYINKKDKRAFVAWSDFKKIRVGSIVWIERQRWFKKRNLFALASVMNPHILFHLMNRAKRIHEEEAALSVVAGPKMGV